MSNHKHFVQDAPKYFDSRMLGPFLLWVYIFYWLIISLCTLIFESFTSFFSIVFLILVFLCLFLIYFFINGEIMVMTYNAKKIPVEIERNNNLFLLKRGGVVRSFTFQNIKQIYIIKVNKINYAVSVDFHNHNEFEDAFIEEINYYKKTSGKDMSLTFPYIGGDTKFAELVGFFHGISVFTEEKKAEPCGLVYPSLVYLICGTLMNFLVLFFAIRSVIN